MTSQIPGLENTDSEFYDFFGFQWLGNSVALKNLVSLVGQRDQGPKIPKN